LNAYFIDSSVWIWGKGTIERSLLDCGRGANRCDEF
jgi:hypothetical protein